MRGLITAGVVLGSAVALLAVRGDAGHGEGATAPLWSPSGIRQRASALAAEIAAKRAPAVGTTEVELMQEGRPAPERSASGSASTAPPREHVYRADAATLSRLLGDHERERPDVAWAPEQSVRLQKIFAQPASSPPSDVQIECRSKTCVARLTFASAALRRAYLAGPELPLVPGCHGISALPGELVNDAPAYEARVIYLCRP